MKLKPLVAVMFASVAFAAPAHAADNGSGPPPTTKKQLESKGYSCEYVSTDYWQCTKKGSPTWMCSDYGRRCEKQPFGSARTPRPGRERSAGTPDDRATVDRGAGPEPPRRARASTTARPPIAVPLGSAVTTPFTLPNGASITATPLPNRRVLIESVAATGAPVSAVIPTDGPAAVAKSGFWGKLWSVTKKVVRWAVEHLRIVKNQVIIQWQW